jgi:hypothetical protein
MNKATKKTYNYTQNFRPILEDSSFIFGPLIALVNISAQLVLESTYLILIQSTLDYPG